MKVLAFDTATSSCSAAVWQKNKIIAYRNQAMVRGHAEHLMEMISDVLAESGFNMVLKNGNIDSMTEGMLSVYEKFVKLKVDKSGDV